MSLFSEHDHAANAPETWQVTKVGESAWRLTTRAGDTLEQFSTKREALEARSVGHLVKLYEQEGAWYAGERVAGWRMYRGTCEECARPIEESEHKRLERDIDFVEHFGHLIRRRSSVAAD